MAEKRKINESVDGIGNDVTSKKRRKSGNEQGQSRSTKLTSANGVAVQPRFTDEDKALAVFFDDLASETFDVRIKAATGLLKFLDATNDPSPRIVDKALRRLIRGLCSNRKAARLGFSTALSELLRKLYASNENAVEPPLPVADIVPFILDQTQPDHEGPSREKRDTLLGRVFGLNAVLVSKIDLQPGQRDTIIDHLIELANSSPVLREQCGSVLYAAVKSAGKDDSQSSVSDVVAKIVANGLAKTPEGVAIWLEARAKIGESALPREVWYLQDPLCSKERSALARVMLDNFEETSPEANSKKSNQKSQTGLRRRKPSFAWTVVLAALQEHAKAKKKLHLQTSEYDKLWVDLVDNTMFASTASHERKSLGLQIFMDTLQTVPRESLQAIFSPHLMNCLRNQVKNEGNMLNSAASTALKAVQARASRHPSDVKILLDSLTVYHGIQPFRGTIEGILKKADEKTLLKSITSLEKSFLQPQSDEVEAERRAVLDVLVGLLHSRAAESISTSPEQTWSFSILWLFAKYAYFSRPDAANPQISDKTRNVCRERLTNATSHLMGSDSDTAARTIITLVSSLPALSKGLVFRSDEKIKAELKRAQKMLKKLDTERNRTSSTALQKSLHALQLLCAMTILQVYNAEPDAVDMLDDVVISSKSFLERSGDSTDNADALFDFILAFASKPSTLFSKLATMVFTAFASDLSEEALQSILDVLEKREDITGQQDLFDQDDSDVEEAEGSDDDDIGEASDVEMVGEEDGESGHSDGDEEDADEDDDDGEAADFEAKLALALGTSKAKTGEDADSADDDNDEQSDGSDMDDDQMMALEPALTQIFVQRKAAVTPKREREDAKKTMIVFKSRVLDLLSVFVKTQTSNALGLKILVPLLELIKSTTDRSLVNKAHGIINDYNKKCRGDSAPSNLEKDELIELLKNNHEQAMEKNGGKPFKSLDASKAFRKACLTANFLIGRLLINMKREYIVDAMDAFASMCNEGALNSKRDVGKEFRTQWMNWYNEMC